MSPSGSFYYHAPVIMAQATHVIVLEPGRIRCYPVAEWAPAPNAKIITSCHCEPTEIEKRMIAAVMCN